MSAGPGPMGGVKKKYKVLRFIAVLIKIFAIVAGALLIIGGLVTIIAGAASSTRSTTIPQSLPSDNPMAFLGSAVFGFMLIVYGVFLAVFLYAYAEWMHVFMDIEENTRMTNEMLMGRK
jgi:hypothetical protein